MAVAVSFGVKKREVVHVHLAASAFSFAVAWKQPEKVIFLAVFSFLFSCSCPDSQVLDVFDDSSEGLPVSLVKQGVVDGWKASMIILAHLVEVNGSFVGQTELVLDSSSVVNTERGKKQCKPRSRRPEFADWFALGPSDRP